MNREQRYAAYIGLMIGLLMPLLFVLTGCTAYTIQRGTEGCPECTTVKVRSMREFEQPVVHYGRTADSVTFDFAAASATNADPLSAIGGAVVQEMLQRYFPAPAVDE
jgi:hypothetical protein